MDRMQTLCVMLPSRLRGWPGVGITLVQGHNHKGSIDTRMNEAQARQFLLVRSVESEDRDGVLLTREDRAQADQAGRSGGERDFLARRSEFAAVRLETRHPRVGDVLRYARWPTWLGWLVPLAALLFGFASNEIDSSKHMNIIAFPLVGMFAWNFAVYLGVIGAGLAGLARGGAKGQGFLANMVRSIARRAADRMRGQDGMGRALAGFLGEWNMASAKLTSARGARTLHLGAALFAVGVIGGLYLRALGIEYRAGWESTFLGPDAVHRIISLLLGPASALTNVPLPDAAHISSLRWSAGSSGENAGPWIHLYAASAALFVIAPRLLLAAWSAAKVWRLAHHFPVPGREDFYVRRLLRSVEGGAGVVRVTPYAYRPSDATIARLTRLIRAAFGDGAKVEIDSAVDYGAEEEWLDNAGLAPETDHHLLLFNLASTPEAENHGTFARGVMERIKAAKSGTATAALLDESSYRQRLGAQSDSDARLTARRSAWEDMLRGAGVPVFAADLDTEEEIALVKRLEAAFARDAAMQEMRR